jgi:serine phosphatase RsbU (regulator of sigma subunit)
LTGGRRSAPRGGREPDLPVIVSRRLSPARLLLAAAVVAAIYALLWQVPFKPLHVLLLLGMVGSGLLLVLLLGWRLLRAFLFKVSRRLAFSYFLIGVLPIPMVLLLLGVVSYLLASYFLGHLYRDALHGVASEVEAAARHRAATYALTGAPPANAPPGPPGVVFAYYRRGRRVAGDPRLPEVWPVWAAGGAPAGGAGREGGAGEGRWPRFFTVNGSSPTLAAAAAEGERGVAALFLPPLERELSRRSGLWVELTRPEERGAVNVELGGRILPFMRARQAANQLPAAKFFRDQARGSTWGDKFLDRPLLWWAEMSGPLVDLGTGRELADHVLATLNGTPRTLGRHLFSASAEIDAGVWGALVALGVLLLNVYLAAVLMAGFMIVGLSRAVNRLSKATDAVRRGDFAVRIPVRRRDQVGELQSSFNEMAGDLEKLVSASAQKEVLEKELALARNLQKSLLPSDLPSGEGVEFATLFEPSAAIGGDYFDVLRLSPREIAVIIADVSGHGLSTGLRMAMLKAALIILFEQTRDPGEILDRLDAVVRSNADSRYFVTATIGIVDLKTGKLRLTNAGHPPTYRVRGGRVDEFMLPGSALGGLGHSYGRAEIPLEPGDIVVWLSDGLIEATNPADDPFGYDQVVRALAAEDGGAAAPDTATAVRDRLLAAVARHVEGQPPGDDRTLVALRWGTRAARPAAPPAHQEALAREAGQQVGAGG